MDHGDISGSIRNFNGTGYWSVEVVQRRYREYCAALEFGSDRTLAPKELRENDVLWVHPIMDEVISGIEEGDPACVALGVDFIEEDAHFPFGATLKSNTARALRRTKLTDLQQARLRIRIATMLASGIIPREMREYVKLLRKIGVGEQWPRLERQIPRDNPYAMRFYRSLCIAAARPISGELPAPGAPCAVTPEQ